jgi:hypothetical protein
VRTVIFVVMLLLLMLCWLCGKEFGAIAQVPASAAKSWSTAKTSSGEACYFGCYIVTSICHFLLCGADFSASFLHITGK